MKKFLLNWLFVVVAIILLGSIFFSVPLLFSFLNFPEWTVSLWFFIVFTGFFTFLIINED